MDGQDCGDLATFLTDADLNAHRCSRIDGGVAARFQYGSVQEHSPEPSASSTKPKPLSALNHLTAASMARVPFCSSAVKTG